MGWVFLLVSVVFFFLAAVESSILPRPTAWGLVCLALGLLIGERGRSVFQRQP